MRTLFALMLITFYSCAKEKRYENRLEGSQYAVTRIEVDGSLLFSSSNNYPITLKFDDCNNRKELCNGTWNRNGYTANFNWKFGKNGKRFELSSQSPFEIGSQEFVFIGDCYKCSGTYTVTSFEKKSMILNLESTSTEGYPNQKVKLVLQKL